MKCPKCDSDLVKKTRYGIEVDYCPNDHGTWLDYQELDQLEDRKDRIDDEKGSLILSTPPRLTAVPSATAHSGNSSIASMIFLWSTARTRTASGWTPVRKNASWS